MNLKRLRQVLKHRLSGDMEEEEWIVAGTSTTRLVVEVISAMVEKELRGKELWLSLPGVQIEPRSHGAPPPRSSNAAARQRGSGGRQSRASIPFSSMSRFILDFRWSLITIGDG
ncbi:unnamed protein product [Boreogadus saida]